MTLIFWQIGPGKSVFHAKIYCFKRIEDGKFTMEMTKIKIVVGSW